MQGTNGRASNTNFVHVYPPSFFSFASSFPNRIHTGSVYFVFTCLHNTNTGRVYLFRYLKYYISFFILFYLVFIICFSFVALQNFFFCFASSKQISTCSYFHSLHTHTHTPVFAVFFPDYSLFVCEKAS